MELVVDTSAVIAVLANEPEREHLIQRTRGARLLAPYSVHWEIGNAFSAMLRRDRINLTQAVRGIQLYQSIPIKLVDVSLEGALEIADAFEIYAYDAYLIRCALTYSAPLFSLDGRLIEVAKQVGVPVIEVSES